MTTENWISIIGIISGGCIGYLIKYSLDKRTLFSSKNAEIKREIYKDYVNTILKTVNEFQQQDGAPSKSQQERLIKELQNFHKKLSFTRLQRCLINSRICFSMPIVNIKMRKMVYVLWF